MNHPNWSWKHLKSFTHWTEEVFWHPYAIECDFVVSLMGSVSFTKTLKSFSSLPHNTTSVCSTHLNGKKSGPSCLKGGLGYPPFEL